MFGKLKALFSGGEARREERIADEYSDMSKDERHTADMLRTRGPEGARELDVEHQADRYVDAEEGRPRED
jgi:hypothetical protein